jgi:hypothetical protein
MQYPRLLLPHLLIAATLALATRSHAQSNNMTYEVTTLTGQPGKSGFVNGAKTKARFFNPSDVAVDGSGNIYVADAWNNAIRKTSAKGFVSTVVKGVSWTTFAVDAWGNNFYVGDGTTNAVFRVASTGPVTTLAGGGKPWPFEMGNLFGGLTTNWVNWGFADGTGVAARFSGPRPGVVDGAGNVYVSDNHAIRRITTDGVVTTIAGGRVDSTERNGDEIVVRTKSGFANGLGTNALFDSPAGLAVDGAGNIYVADWGNSAIRKITTGGLVTTIAGNGLAGFRDGTNALLDFPLDVAVDGSGNVYVADTGNHAIRKITSGGVVTTIAGSGVSGFRDGTDALFDFPSGLAVDGAGNIYVADSGNHVVRKIPAPPLVIVKAPQTITWTNFPATNKFRRNAKIPLDATSSSGLAVTYTSSRTSVLQIVGTNAVIKGRGTNTITASQSGNANYSAASNVTRTIVIR